MAVETDENEFQWTTADEPHTSRRQQIVKKDYAPKLRKLMTNDWTLSYWILGLFTIQLTIAWQMRSADMLRLVVAAYCIGGTCSHALALAMHEVTHNLALGYKYPTANRFLAWFANLPIGLPAAASFKKFHLIHHKYQGIAELDSDVPTEFEARFFKNTPGKIVWMFLQPLVYLLRPVLAYPQIAFNALLVYFASWKSLFYLIFATLAGYGIHPISGHFIAEHYAFVRGTETASYYGPLNWLTCNGGYHNEHHDFPNIPGRFLPEVKKIASEFYDHLPSHRSWTKVLFDFATDPQMTLFSRVKRSSKRAGSPSSGVGTESASSTPPPTLDVKAKDSEAAELDDDLLNENVEVSAVLRQRHEKN